jgi:hypothetical protein
MRIKLALFLGFLLPAICSWGQDTLWTKTKIDEKLAVDLPGLVSGRDTLEQKIVRGKTSSAVYYVSRSKQDTKLQVDNKESLKSTYAGIVRGFLSKAKKPGYRDSVSEYTIGPIIGRRINLSAVGENHGHYAREMDSYLFLVDDKLYCVGVAFKNAKTTDDERDLKRFLSSVVFSVTQPSEARFGSRAESIGYKLGGLVGTLIVIGVLTALVFLIVYLIKKAKKGP